METALTRFLNLRLERGKRGAGEDLKVLTKRGGRSTRNAKKARQRQAAASAAPTDGDAPQKSTNEGTPAPTGGWNWLTFTSDCLSQFPIRTDC